MKIKIITCHYAYNYGAVLQAYALSTYLLNCEHDVEVINYRPWYRRGYSTTKNKMKLAARQVLRVPDNIKSEKVFGEFATKNIKLTKELKNYNDLKKADLVADLFIVGSDQVWNMNTPTGNDPAFYLEFANGRCMSYAASFGMNELNIQQQNFICEKLAKFDVITVREETGKRILNDAGVENVMTVLDPVYLLKEEQWEDLSKKPKNFPKEKYVLVFAFNRQKEIFTHGKQLARKYGYSVASVNTYWEDIFQGTDHYYWNCTPQEFLYLIKNAQVIVTNSFHGLSFSLIFNKPVILYQKAGTGNSRMLDLLKTFGAEIIDDNIKKNLSIPEIPYELINVNMQAEIENAKTLLDTI